MSKPGEYVLELMEQGQAETEKFFAENPDRHKLGAAQGFVFGWILGATDQYAKFARPIPVSERLPEDGQRCQWYAGEPWKEHCHGWRYGVYQKETDDDNACVLMDYNFVWQHVPTICVLSTFSHWLPEPPKPE